MFVLMTRRLPALVSLLALLAVVFACQSSGADEESTPVVDGSTGAELPAGNAEGGVQDPQNPSPPISTQQGEEELANERAKFLSKKYLDSARQLQIEGKLEEAKLALLRAKELTPADQNVLSALASVQAQLGEPAGEAQTYAEQMARLWKIREQRAKAEATDRIQSGRTALEDERYGDAIADFRSVLLRIESGPDIEWGDLGEQASRLLGQAQEAQAKHLVETTAAVEREILQERRREEEAERARMKARVDGYLQTAVRAFDNGKYSLAQDLAYEAMTLDPTSYLAKDIHNTATKALRETRSDRYLRIKRQEYLKLLETTEELRVPQTDILRVDPVTWEIANKRTARTLPSMADDPDDAAVKEQVRTKTVASLSFTEETGDYEEVVRLLRTVTDVPIILTPEAKEVISDESLTLEITIVAPLAVSNFLDLMVSKSENLAWTVRNGVVEITSKLATGGQNSMVTHDVRDLVYPRTEFLPPVIRDIPSGDGGFGESAPRLGGEGDEKVAYIEPDILQENIKSSTGGETYWEAEGGGQMEYVDSGYLLVYANPEMQRRVEKLLNDQRRFATSVVTIETKFLTIAQAFLQQIGVDWRGLGGSGNKGTAVQLDDITNKLDDNASRGLDNQGTGDDAGHPFAGAFFNDGADGDVRARTENFFESALGQALSTQGGATAAITLLDDLEVQLLIRAVEKRENVQVVNSQMVSVLNNERANMAVINQTSYLRDFDVEVAQASFIADPKVDVIQDGVVLDVRPTISHDQRYVMLSLQPTVAELARPIPTFTTSLAGATLPVTLQLPQLTVRSFATTAQVPDGGSVLLGGLRELFRKERRAEIPLLAEIPILSFLFKEEGIADENTSLTVLVTSTITDLESVLGARR